MISILSSLTLQNYRTIFWNVGSCAPVAGNFTPQRRDLFFLLGRRKDALCAISLLTSQPFWPRKKTNPLKPFAHKHTGVGPPHQWKCFLKKTRFFSTVGNKYTFIDKPTLYVIIKADSFPSARLKFNARKIVVLLANCSAIIIWR